VEAKLFLHGIIIFNEILSFLLYTIHSYFSDSQWSSRETGRLGQ